MGARDANAMRGRDSRDIGARALSGHGRRAAALCCVQALLHRYRRRPASRARSASSGRRNIQGADGHDGCRRNDDKHGLDDCSSRWHVRDRDDRASIATRCGKWRLYADVQRARGTCRRTQPGQCACLDACPAEPGHAAVDARTVLFQYAGQDALVPEGNACVSCPAAFRQSVESVAPGLAKRHIPCISTHGAAFGAALSELALVPTRIKSTLAAQNHRRETP